MPNSKTNVRKAPTNERLHGTYSPLTWRYTKIRGQNVVIVRCPIGDDLLLDTKVYEVDREGNVYPEVECKPGDIHWRAEVVLVTEPVYIILKD